MNCNGNDDLHSLYDVLLPTSLRLCVANVIVDFIVVFVTILMMIAIVVNVIIIRTCRYVEVGKQ